MIRWLAMLALVFTGCVHPAPPHEDAAYWESPAGQAELEREGNTILRLRHQLYGEPLYNAPDDPP